MQSALARLTLAAVVLTTLVLAACGSGGAEAPGDGPTPVPAGDTEAAATPEAAPAPGAPGAGDATDAETGPTAKADAAVVTLGVDILLRDSLHLVRGRRVGLVTNHTGLSWEWSGPGGGSDGGDVVGGPVPVPTIDRLADHPAIALVALFSPEHGIRGRAEAGEKVASEVDPATGLPIHSLYGETRRPTPEMLRDVDVLLFDIQDIGTRYYTYVWTMALAMEAAGEAGIPFVVLDRPNPLGGRLVQGNVLDPDYATFVGLYPVPMRHGLTAGELARFLVAEHGLTVDLTVVPMEGWSRDMWYDATGLPFVPPSPNMPSLESATHYPGTCLFEGTNLSVGRGTDRAFQQIGAPWLDAPSIAAALGAAGLPGVRFVPVTFAPQAPGDGKYPAETVQAVRFEVTDRTRYDPVHAAVALLIEIQRLHPDRLEWREAHFDRLAGTDRLRLRILDGASLQEITAPWPRQRTGFQTAVIQDDILLYR